MLKIKNLLLNKHNFALVYISLVLLRSVFLLQEYVDDLCKVCMLWGIFILCFDLWKHRLKFFKAHGSLIPFVLCAVYGISVLVNYKYALYGGIKNLLYTVIYLFVLYDMKCEYKDKDFLKYFKRNNDVFILLNTVVNIASIMTFLLGIKFIYEYEGNMYKVGFWYNRLNGVWNSNLGTMLGLIAVVLCFVNYFISNGNIGKKKILYITHFVIQFIYYALASSRAATICYAIVFAILLGFCVYPLLKKKKGQLKALGIIAGIFVLICVSEGGLVKGTQFLMKSAAKVSQTMIYGEEDDEEEPEDIEFERVEDLEEGDITNARAGMWKAAIKIIKQHPVLGIAYPEALDADGNLIGNIDGTLMNEEDISFLKKAGFYYHNGFIQIALCGGLALLLVFSIFVIKTGCLYLKCIFSKNAYGNEYKIFVCIFAVVAALFVDNMVEVHLLFGGQDPAASILWYLLGCGIAISSMFNEGKANETNEKRKA